MTIVALGYRARCTEASGKNVDRLLFRYGGSAADEQ
jgi:hypothetical protein